MNELILKTECYVTTAMGTEVIGKSTKGQWRTYGEILRRVEEAKQWAIGDWLRDGKQHYGDGLYREAAEVLGLEEKTLREYKFLSGVFALSARADKVSWRHHYQVASLKPTVVTETGKAKGKWKLGDEPDREKMTEFLDKAAAKKWSTRDLAEKVKLYKAQQQQAIELANEPEKYKVIYADPPWKYNDKLIEGYGAADHHYPQMSIAELCALPVKSLAMDNSVLFLWTTSPMLEECFSVVSAWGFTYKSSFVWDKVKHNYGHYNSVRHELLLICTRGSCVPQADTLLDSVVELERSDKHSEKPEEFRNIIEMMYPDGKRIELFARIVADGWDRWGLESEAA